MYKEIFHQRLKQARINAGYTQKQIAEILEISQSKLSHYENGTNEPNIETIGKLADFYDIQIDWLFGMGRRQK